MELTPQSLALIGALAAFVGVLAASLFNLITSTLNRKSEERKHYRQLIINAAVENWKHLGRNPSPGSNYLPLDDHILHMMKFTELMIDQKVDESNLEQKLKEIKAFMDKIVTYRLKELEEDRNQ